MAIAFDSSSSGIGGSASITVSHTCSGSDRVLFVVWRTTGDATPNVSSASYAGEAMTLVDVQGANNDLNNAVYLYYILNPATGTNDISVTMQSTATIGSLAAASYTGVGSIGATNKTYGTTSGNYTNTVTTTKDNSWLVMGAYAVQSAGTGTTSRANNNDVHIFDSNGAKSPTGSYSLVAVESYGNDVGTILAEMKLPALNYSITPTVFAFNTSWKTVILHIGKYLLASLGQFTQTLNTVVVSVTRLWTKATKNSTTLTGTSKSTTSWTEESKNTSTFTNETK